MEINITPRFEDSFAGPQWVRMSFCQNCGVLVTARAMPMKTEAQAHEKGQIDATLFLQHLDTHYENISEET